MSPSSVYVEAAFVLAVTGAAMIWPPLALLVGAAFLAALAFIVDRRAVTEPAPEPAP